MNACNYASNRWQMAWWDYRFFTFSNAANISNESALNSIKNIFECIWVISNMIKYCYLIATMESPCIKFDTFQRLIKLTCEKLPASIPIDAACATINTNSIIKSMYWRVKSGQHAGNDGEQMKCFCISLMHVVKINAAIEYEMFIHCRVLSLYGMLTTTKYVLGT